jgi:hypothetical protein
MQHQSAHDASYIDSLSTTPTSSIGQFYYRDDGIFSSSTSDVDNRFSGPAPAPCDGVSYRVFTFQYEL